jgi:hypothetical protein
MKAHRRSLGKRRLQTPCPILTPARWKRVHMPVRHLDHLHIDYSDNSFGLGGREVGVTDGNGCLCHVVDKLRYCLCLSVTFPFISIRLHPDGLSQLSPASQLPMIAVLTAVAGGRTIYQATKLSPDQQVPTIVISYLLVGMGLPLGFTLDALFCESYSTVTADRQHIPRHDPLPPLGARQFCVADPWQCCLDRELL